jgi:hypothetical protein
MPVKDLRGGLGNIRSVPARAIANGGASWRRSWRRLGRPVTYQDLRVAKEGVDTEQIAAVFE